ncbi:fibroblast growth factor receptor substrate 2a [Xyrauchen texanus]|uniref:fibroblast growth factor receptor substrate 2a n=1 Tax=Xyrauchen texanus TaxID=154827 RepID=UPI0022428F2E|nr:fibroblast growth factor receptor substrate 2a [Xyrauchen texanus]XP_051974515.1 fibroblast growth factor receptor substrate 2a [Xyrauchen texanus]XP_051974516.1 fibroblast growth factor receptor substrate 2a [Xyrauchen texanus]
MGSCCSCPEKEIIPDNHHNKFKVINVDDDGNELGSGVMELTEEELILHTRKRDAVKWPYLCLRRYGYDSNLFSFECGRRCQTGQGIFAFKCARAEDIFNMLQDIMHNNSISVVEEPVQEPELPVTPHTPTTPGYSVPTVANAVGRYPSFGDSSSRPSSRHPSVGSARLPSVGEESTHPLLLNDEMVHTYVNTTGLQDERRCRTSGHAPLEIQTPNSESAIPASPNEVEPQVVLEPESVTFVLGPTPVQRQMLLKERPRDFSEQDLGAVSSSVKHAGKTVNGCAGSGTDCDTGYDSDERKEASHEQYNGVAPPRRNRPPVPLPDTHNANNSAQRRTALLNYENLPALPPVWETRKPYSEAEDEEELKSPSLNGFHLPHSFDPQHNYVNTENVTVQFSAHNLQSSSAQPTVFNFDLRRLGVGDPLRQLNYIELEMDKVSDSSGPQTPTTPLPPTPTRRTELYTVIDIARTAAMSSLQKAQPRDDGTSRKTRHNSTDLPM